MAPPSYPRRPQLRHRAASRPPPPTADRRPPVIGSAHNGHVRNGHKNAGAPWPPLRARSSRRCSISSSRSPSRSVMATESCRPCANARAGRFRCAPAPSTVISRSLIAEGVVAETTARRADDDPRRGTYYRLTARRPSRPRRGAATARGVGRGDRWPASRVAPGSGMTDSRLDRIYAQLIRLYPAPSALATRTRCATASRATWQPSGSPAGWPCSGSSR